MKPADFTPQSAPKTAPPRPRILFSLIFGSILLHVALLWAIAQFPTAPSKTPEKLIEVELRDFYAAPKVSPPRQIRSVAPQKALPRVASVPRVRQMERVPRVAPRIQPKPVVVPRPVRVRRVVVPTAPLVRSTRVVSKTGIVAKKPVVTSPTAAPLPPSPNPQPQKTQPQIFPRPSNPARVTKNQATKPALVPDQGVGEGKGSGNGSGEGSGQGSGSGSGQGSGQGSGNGSGAGSGSGSGQGSGAGAGQGSGTGNGQGSGSGNGNGSGQGNGSGDGSGSGNGNGGGGGGGGGGGNGGGGGGNGGGGGPFGVGGQTGEGPRHIVYILDVSISMEPRIERAKQELRDALSGLQPGESFNIVAFYGKFRLFSQKLVAANPKNIAKGREFIDSLQLNNGTNLERAFEKAFAARDVNVMVVITDGVPTYGERNFAKLARRVRGLNRSNARIYTVGLVGKNPDGTDDSFEASGLLERIAGENGGQFKTVRIDAPPQPDFPE